MSADSNMRPSSCREFVEDLTGKSTRRSSNPELPLAEKELWYLVYRDEFGAAHTVKGSTTAIRRSLKDGHLGDADAIKASRTKSGPFELLRGYPEFRDLVVTAAPVSPAALSPNSRTSIDPIDTPPVSPSRSRVTPSPVATTPAPQVEVPHIALEQPPETSPGSSEWLKYLFLMALAIGSALVAFYFIPLPH
jgi:hypothetical protein